MIEKEELEALIRRVVREELLALLNAPAGSILEDCHQGPEDPEQDAILLRDALSALRADRDRPEAWISWEECEAELDRAEAAGELPA